jgi:hypothetical protein
VRRIDPRKFIRRLGGVLLSKSYFWRVFAIHVFIDESEANRAVYLSEITPGTLKPKAKELVDLSVLIGRYSCQDEAST